MAASAALERTGASRRLLLETIGDPRDLTLVRGPGNRGDELIWEGTRALLSDRIYREVDLAGLCAASGDTVVLAGGGAFCRPYHEVMPRALAVAELRFDRVIVLPSSFDPGEDVVRAALAQSRATVFAREPESLRRIAPLCEARLAHDCAFFFDYAPWIREGTGTLNAFRTDHEALPAVLPDDNVDVSATARTLEEWLATIAAHELVRTDRAHVMIAAALLGKRVQYRPDSYHKVDAIARAALADLPVEPLESPEPVEPVEPAEAPRDVPGGQPSHPTSQARRTAAPAPKVSAVVLTRDRPQRALAAIDSIERSETAHEIIVLDNNSGPQAARVLAGGCAGVEAVSFQRSERNLGCAGGRQLALERARGELVLFLDDDAELEPGALGELVADLDAHPEAAAVTATVTFPDGTVHHSGGWIETADGVVDFPLITASAPAALSPSGPVDWVPGTAVLIRRAILEAFPIDTAMHAYYEDNEWCYRVRRAGVASFRRSREARAVHHFSLRYGSGVEFASRSRAVDLLHAHARFYELHGLLLGVGLFDLAPELRDEAGTRDVAAARLLMELLLAKGTDWTLMEWMNGGLDGLLSGRRDRARLDRQLSAQARQLEVQARTLAEREELLKILHDRHLTLERVENGGWWRLRQRLLPALALGGRVKSPRRR